MRREKDTTTLHELPLMYEYIERLKGYFLGRYGKEIIVLEPKTTFEDWVLGKIKRGKKKGYIRGVPMVWSEPCYWRREAKEKPQTNFYKKMFGKHKIYLGYTTSEKSRKMKDEKFLYPLIDIFKMSETDCLFYTLRQDMENPLYRYFTRTGCGFCPGQSERSFFEVWKNFKDTWEYMKNIEKSLFELEKQGEKIKNKYWFTGYRSMEKMEAKFDIADKQGKIYDFSNEPMRDCFCKI